MTRRKTGSGSDASRLPPRRVVLAAAAHPDDIEFLMAGTLIGLIERGWQGHYWNLASGSCGSLTIPAGTLCKVRRQEARAAAQILGAVWHPPIADDIELFYDDRTVRRVGAVIRAIRPTLILTHSLEDYMEDHAAAARLVVTAAFTRAMPNYRTRPPRATYRDEVVVYHAMPHGLVDEMRRPIAPELCVHTGPMHSRKLEALAAHRSQQAWLDASQGLNSYLAAMDEMSRAVGRMSGKFRQAEGWRRHSHLGFCGPDADPLRAAFGRDCTVHRGRGLARKAADFPRKLFRGGAKA